jgi:hypothetical protein
MKKNNNNKKYEDSECERAIFSVFRCERCPIFVDQFLDGRTDGRTQLRLLEQADVAFNTRQCRSRAVSPTAAAADIGDLISDTERSWCVRLAGQASDRRLLA